MDEGTMVAEVKCENGTWEVFASDPLPLEIDDEIKQEHANDFLPGPRPGPDDCHKSIPFSPPMTHLQHDLPIIAKYPLDDWERTNRPCLTTTGWCKLAMSMSTMGMVNIQSCFEVAKRQES